LWVQPALCGAGLFFALLNGFSWLIILRDFSYYFYIFRDRKYSFIHFIRRLQNTKSHTALSVISIKQQAYINLGPGVVWLSPFPGATAHGVKA